MLKNNLIEKMQSFWMYTYYHMPVFVFVKNAQYVL